MGEKVDELGTSEVPPKLSPESVNEEAAGLVS